MRGRSTPRRTASATSAVMAASALLVALTQALTAPSAHAESVGTGVIGDSFAAAAGGLEAAGNNFNVVAGPDAGDARATVDTSSGTVHVVVGPEGQQSKLILAWPLRVGTWTPFAGTSGEPETHVQVRRPANSVGCMVSDGTLVVHEAEADDEGGVAVLSVDLTGGWCPSGRAAASVRIGSAAPIAAVPVASPRAFSTKAEEETALTHKVVVTNTGPGPWTVREAAVSREFVGSGRPRVFSVVSTSDTCTGSTLPVGAQCEVTVTGTATNRNAEEHLIVAGDGAADVVVPLSIEGLTHVPPPTNVAVLAGRTGAQVSWTAPYYERYSVTHIYDVTAGTRTLLATAGSSGRVRLPGRGPRTLALVRTSEPIHSPEVRVEVPAGPAEIVAENAQDGVPVAFGIPSAGQPAPERKAAWMLIYKNSPTSTVHTVGDGIALDPTRTRWLVWSVGGGLWLCDFDGSTCEVIPNTGRDAIGIVRTAAWLPDGRIAALSGDAEDRTLWTITVAGATRAVATLPASPWWFNFTALPSGTEVAAIGWDGIHRIRLSDGHVTSVPGTRDTDRFTVTTAGTLVLQERLDMSLASGPTRATVISLDGRRLKVLPLPSGDNRHVTFSPAGDRLAFIRQLTDSTAEIWTAKGDGTGAARLSAQVGSWRRLHWSADDAVAPSVRLSVPTASRSSVTVGVNVDDADDPAGGLLRQCRLDQGAWTACTSTWKLSGLSAGPHTVSARVTSPSGRTVTTTRSWLVDLISPSTKLKPSPAIAGDGWRLRWIGRDNGGSGVASYDVRMRQRTANGFGPWIWLCQLELAPLFRLDLAPPRRARACVSR